MRDLTAVSRDARSWRRKSSSKGNSFLLGKGTRNRVKAGIPED